MRTSIDRESVRPWFVVILQVSRCLAPGAPPDRNTVAAVLVCVGELVVS